MMKKLKPDWVTEGLLDFEYKKYLLMAYLQGVASNFDEQRLYPFLADLIFHYRNLVSIRDNKVRTSNSFPGKISKLDLQEFRIEYEKIIEDPEYLDVITQILDFAIPRLEAELRRGRDIYELVEEKMKIEPIGLMPIDKDAGYLFLYSEKVRDARVYHYQTSFFESHEETYRGIKTTYLSEFSPSIANTFESHKLELIRSNRELPNPATWLISTALLLPLEETFLPVAKRTLVRLLAQLSSNNEAPQAGLS